MILVLVCGFSSLFMHQDRPNLTNLTAEILVKLRHKLFHRISCLIFGKSRIQLLIIVLKHLQIIFHLLYVIFLCV